MNSEPISARDKIGILSEGKAELLERLLAKRSGRTRTVPQFARIAVASRARAPASGAQRRIWFIDRLEGGSAAYHIGLSLKLNGALDEEALQASLDTLVARHESLRTVFVEEAGEPLQEIATSGRFELCREDMRKRGGSEQEVDQQLREEMSRSFDLRHGPLVRGCLWRIEDDKQVLVITMHHIVSDGWSMGVLMGELARLYEAYCRGGAAQLPALPIQYADYAHWQQQRVSGGELQGGVRYWKEHLSGAPALLELPTDRPRPAVQSYRGANVVVSIGSQLTEELRVLSRRHHLTMAMTLYATWALTLSRLSGQSDVVIGMPVANRRRTELEGLIGLFVNTLAVRVRLEDEESVEQLLQRVKRSLLEAYTHEDVPFEQVVEALQPARTLSHSPLFQVMFVLQNAASTTLELGALRVVEQEVPIQTAQFDLSLSLGESAGGIEGVLNYASDLFDASTVARWVRSYKTVLRELTRAPTQSVRWLSLLDAAEREQVVESFNATQVTFGEDQLLHELIEVQVARTPDEVAVVFEGQTLSYAQLNGRANQLARYLRKYGVGADELVGICVERSLEMVVGLLGILKAGGAYVPLDPSYPPERLSYMLQDAAPRVLLTQGRLKAHVPAGASEVVVLDEDWARIELEASSNLALRSAGLRSDHLAYVIYTSGSTGEPKGAMNEHRGVINRLQWMQQAYGLSGEDRVLQKTPFSFDVSVWEFFWTLMSGARLIVVRPQGHQDPEYLKQLIEQTGVTRLHFVPSMLQIFLEGHRAGECAGVRQIVCSGEELPVGLQNRCLQSLPQARLSNLYGPTEAAVDVTSWECEWSPGSTRVPIGRPIANVRMYVLDEHLQPVPIGVSGELYIGGVGVGRGYLRREALTRKRFVSDPFSEDELARLYKTGDVGRWRADGALEYLGRNDHQVKIRGLRIELGEIEAQLTRVAQVKEAAVIAREDVPGEKRLVAYIVVREGVERLSVEALRTHLKAVLPEYMVPSAVVSLDRLPLMPNGKLDRRGLPVPDGSAYARREYEAPQGEVEEILAGIWQSLLRVERVSRQDNFFELGGHSLLIMQVIERLRRVGLSVELRRVFESATLASLAQALTTTTAGTYVVPANGIPPQCEAIEPRMLPLVQLEPGHIERIVRSVPGGASNIQDIYPLAPLQEGILFHHLLDAGGGDTYVVPMLLSVSSHEQLQQLIAALQAVIDRHDVLRTALLWEELPQPLQVVLRRAELQVRELSFDSSHELDAQLRIWVEPQRQRLDLREAPLLRLQTAYHEPSSLWYVRLQLHHIIIDHVTLETIGAELHAHLGGSARRLANPGQYRDHVARVLAYARDHNAEAFFRGKLGEVEEPTAPFGLLNVRSDATRVAEAHEACELELNDRVRMQARRSGVSVATLFHAAWGLVVARTSGRDDPVFGTVLLGRMQGASDVHQVLGLFINMLPVRLRLREATAQALVEQTQRELVELLSHEQASLAVAQRCSGVPGSAPLFSALLNYRHSGPGAAGWFDLDGIRVLDGQERTNYPLVISIDDLASGFAFKAQTDSRIDPRRIITYLKVALHSLVWALEHAPDSPAVQLEVLPEDEVRRLTKEFNRTLATYPRDQLIQQVFEAHVERTPDAVAIIGDDGSSLTYAQLNAQANRLARYLHSDGPLAGECIPVLMQRSAQMLIAELAVLKSGNVYVPLDPDMSRERREFMIKDCGARRILAQGSRPADDDAGLPTWIDFSALAETLREYASTDLRLTFETMPPAYVMYTSGSTGIPKGVVVPHRAVNRLAINNGYAHIQATDCIAHYSNPTFDASTFEIWGALLNGARVLIVPQSAVLEAHRFAELLKHSGVTLMYMSVGLFNQYTEALREVFARLRYLLVGGDSLEPEAIRRVLRNGPPQHLLNAYGPTECTTFSTTYAIEALPPDVTTIPIGKPISNGQVYILDRHRQLAPLGVSGELYIGGAGVANGYLNRPELTAERFLHDPFDADSQAALYRTGDLCRWHADGVIEFMGRNDHQVKIRGFRVELGEIEARLFKHAAIKDAVVIARNDEPGEKRLVAYIVPDQALEAATAEVVRSYLKAHLPEYMVPSAFVLLERLPLTSNGKLDRRALPAPGLNAYTNREYNPPQGEQEQRLAAIWQALLPVQRVGRFDNFFELGGHSLLIVQMMERLRQVGLTVEVRRVFDTPVLADLAATLRHHGVAEVDVPRNLIPSDCTAITPQMLPLIDLSEEHIRRIEQETPGGAVNIQDIYPLAPLQEGILFHHMLGEGAGDTYVLAAVLAVASHKHLQSLIEAFQYVVDRHDVLRTAVLWEQLPRALQVVSRRATLPVAQAQLDPRRDLSEQIQAWLKPGQQHMDLRRAPLLRLQVAADPQSEQWFVLLQFHHITLDHVSVEIITSEAVACMEGKREHLPPSAPYRNHVAQALAQARQHDSEAFFRKKLGDVVEPTAPFGLLDVHGDGSKVQEADLPLEPKLSMRIRAMARNLGVSAAALFHAGWALVVAHTSAREDVVFGSVLLGRLQGSAGAQRILGMFINTLPLRVQLQGVAARVLIQQIHRELSELLTHEQTSLAAAQRCSGIASSAPLFTALLNYRHSVADAGANWSAESGVRVIAGQERTNYPVMLSVDDLGEDFKLVAQTDSRIDPRRLPRYLHAAMTSLLDALERAPLTPALSLSILPASERREVLELFNGRRASVPDDLLVHQLFGKQAHLAPGALAVVLGDESISYEQLDYEANQLARLLRDHDVGADKLVALCADRSIDMVVALVAILKAGAAYLPLDPNYPGDRLQQMLDDAVPSVLLAQRHLMARLPPCRSQVMTLEDVRRQAEAYPNEELSPCSGAENLVYVIYTSGSTGRPKGTAMPHRAMVNLIEWHRRTFTSSNARVLQFAAFSFDVAFQEIFTTLCTGGTLVLLDEDTRKDPRALSTLLREQRVDRLFVPPLMLQSLAEFCAGDEGVPEYLRDVITAGEQLRISAEIVEFFDRLAHCRLHNHYGPTETHVVTALTMSSDPRQWSVLPTIGSPIDNSQIYILDGQREPVPVGAVGDIYIAGRGLAREYLGKPELTDERFVKDPFSTDADARMYATGDLGKWLPNGEIEYLGRNDDQVKIRGYRIELGEIEVCLARHPQVERAAVIVREDVPGDRRLVAYVVARDGTEPSGETLRLHLRERLPEHMIPGAFVALGELPLTPSGKLNRRGLPAPDTLVSSSEDYQSPTGEVEIALAEIWQQLLRVARLGRGDNFFARGGHSLHGMKLVMHVEQRLGVRLPVAAVFQYPTIADMAQAVSALLPDAGAPNDALDDIAEEHMQFEEGIIEDVIGALSPHSDPHPVRPADSGGKQ